MEDKKSRAIILSLSIGMFLISLFQKSYCTLGNECSNGLMNLLVGWLGCMMGGAGLSWLANPTLIISWIFLKKNGKVSMIFSVIASVFALSFLFFDEIVVNEAGGCAKIISRNIGYWVWLLSCFTMLIGNLISQEQGERDQNEWRG